MIEKLVDVLLLVMKHTSGIITQNVLKGLPSHDHMLAQSHDEKKLRMIFRMRKSGLERRNIIT